MKNSYIIGIGSNYEAEKNIAQTIKKLQLILKGIKCSRFIQTDPINLSSKNPFTNGLAFFFSELETKEIKRIFKNIEKEMGRTAERNKNGIIPIDIDIIVCNDTVLNSDFERDYVQNLLAELNLKI